MILHRAEKCLGYETEGGRNTRIQDFKEGETESWGYVLSRPRLPLYAPLSSELSATITTDDLKVRGLLYAVGVLQHTSAYLGERAHP